MKRSPGARWKRRAYYLHFLVYPVILLYIFANFFGFTIPLLNPSNAPPPYAWSFIYPAVPSCIGVCINDPANTIIIYAQITANQTIAEGSPVVVTASGTIGSNYTKDVSMVSIGFFGAQQRLSGGNIIVNYDFGGVNLVPTNFTGDTVVLGGGSSLTGTSAIIYWPTQGDYSPTLVIQFKNTLEAVNYTYHDYHIHVESAQSVRDSQVNRAILALAVGGLIFAGIDARSVIGFLKDGKEEDDKED